MIDSGTSTNLIRLTRLLISKFGAEREYNYSKNKRVFVPFPTNISYSIPEY